MTGNRKILKNAKWIIVCRSGQALLQLIVGMLSARYLGPSNYGLINYAASVVTFALPLMQLGLQSTLVQELIDAPEKEGEILGTALTMDMISSFGCLIMIYLFVSSVNYGEKETITVCMLYSLSLIFQSMELIQCWFQSKLLSKFPSIVTLIAYIFVSAYKIFLLATKKAIYWFALVNSLQYCIIGVLLVLIYYRLGSQHFSFSKHTAKKLFSKSKYYILAAVMVTVFQNTDHIMLKMISGDSENGFYSAAVTAASVCQFIYQAIIDTARPVVLVKKRENSLNYERTISRLYCIIIYMALLQGVGFTIFAKLIIYILYGETYMAAAPVLRIQVWLIAFSFMGSIRNIWILAEGKQNIVWKLNLAGAILNVFLNMCMIPLWGACGAATASLITQIFTNFVLGFVVKSLHSNNRLILKGINPRILLECLEGLRQGR